MNIIDTIGNTPLIEISKLSPYYPEVKIFAKLEGNNPAGSIKDRTALFLITEAEKSGRLDTSKEILEATSGNTGIGLAMISAYKGYKITLVMSESASIERRKILRAYGANIILTQGELGTDGAILKVREMIEKNPERYFNPNQFDNPDNPLAHFQTTGPEIWNQTDGKINYFVTGIGTTGTLMGIGKYLKIQNPKIKIIAIEPDVGHKVQGLKNMDEAIRPKNYNTEYLDEKIRVSDKQAYEMTRKLAKIEGVFAGISSGANLAGSLEVAERIKSGIIVTIFPDRGDRYLSTEGLF